MSINDELAARGLSARRADGTIRPRTTPLAELQAEIAEYDSLPQRRRRACKKLADDARERKLQQAALNGEATDRAIMALLPLLVTVAEGGPLTASQRARLAEIKPLIMAAGADAAAELAADKVISTSKDPEKETIHWPAEPT